MIDSLAFASAVPQNVITLYSEGYETYKVDITDLEVSESEIGTTASLIRGVAAGFNKKGFKVGGFNAYVIGRSDNVGAL